jgi:two-component system sensor histidine kinase/response regulator
MRKQISIFLILFSSAFMQMNGAMLGSEKSLDSIYSVAFEALQSDIDRSKREARLLIKLATTANDKLNQAYGFDVYGLSLYYADNLDSALFYTNKAIDLFKQIEDQEGLSTAIYNKSLMLEFLAKYNSSIVYLNKARKIDLNRGAKTENDLFYYYRLADILYSQDRYDDALVYAHLSLSAFLKDADNHPYMKPRIFLNLAWLYNELDILELAEYYAKKTYVISPKNTELSNRLSSLQILAEISQKKGLNNEAISFSRKALEIAFQYKDKSEILYAKSMLAYNLQTKNLLDPEVAKIWAELDVSLQGLKDYQKDLSIILDLYDYYKAIENYPKAIVYIEDYNRIKSELNILDVSQIRADFEKELAESERDMMLANIALREKDNLVKNLVIIGISIILLVLLVMLLLSISSSKKIIVLNDSLSESNESLKRKEEELRRSFVELELNYEEINNLNTSKNRLLSILSHDLKQPFNQIIAVLDLIDQDILNYDERKEILGELKTSVEETSSMVNNLLQWSKSQFEGTLYKPELLNLSIIAKRVSLELSVLLKKKSIYLDFAVDDKLFLKADEAQLSSIIRNLLSNAFKFSEANSIIYIFSGISENGNYGLLHIQDKGIGMTPQQIARVLSSDNQSSMPGTNNELGTGIGMMIVQDFIKQNKGYLEVKSSIGKGSTFTIALPFDKKKDLKHYQ